jgi:hypothetical protein
MLKNNGPGIPAERVAPVAVTDAAVNFPRRLVQNILTSSQTRSIITGLKPCSGIGFSPRTVSKSKEVSSCKTDPGAAS